LSTFYEKARSFNTFQGLLKPTTDGAMLQIAEREAIVDAAVILVGRDGA
jgi:hypothetical protein